MPRPESDAHGRHHRSVEVGVDPVVDDTHSDDFALYGETLDHIPVIDPSEPYDPETQAIMSDGVRILTKYVPYYRGNQNEADDEASRHKKLDALVLSSAATIALGAIGLAIYQAKKKH